MMFQKVVRLVPLTALVTAMAGAQQPEPRMHCDDGQYSRGWRGSARVCEIRETTVPATGSLAIDAGRNGHVTVRGWDGDDVLVRAMVEVFGDDEQEARQTAEAIEVSTDDVIEADGPRSESWSVSYEILTPERTDLDVETVNGGIAVENVRGRLDVEAGNGGIALHGLAGDVHGRTQNGGVDVILSGSTWDGEGLDVSTTNGGVRLRVPDGYSARLETATTNGGLKIDFPVTVQGRIGREVSTTLGDGGPLVRVTTVNGGVWVSD